MCGNWQIFAACFPARCVLPRNTSPGQRLRPCCIKTRLLTHGSAFQGARPRRRGDRIVVRFVAVHMSRALFCRQPRRAMSVIGGRLADMRVRRILDPQRTSEGGAAGEPDGHPPIGDFDALTDCTALMIVNCPSKVPTAAIFWIPHFGARVAGKPQSAESATGQRPMQPCGAATRRLGRG